MNQDLLDIGAKLTSAIRSLTPSVLGKRRAKITPPSIPRLKIPSLSELYNQAQLPDFDVLRKGI